MMRPVLAMFLLLLLGAGGCSTSGQDQDPTPAPKPGPDVPDPVKLTYQGPEVQAALHQRPNLHQLLVKVQVPTGGYRLWLEETRRQGAVTAVYFTLQGPGPQEAVTMALEEKQADVALKPESGPVHVYVRQVQRNVESGESGKQPPAELARILERKP